MEERGNDRVSLGVLCIHGKTHVLCTAKTEKELAT